MDAIVLNIFEISYSQLIQYEILEKLVTYTISSQYEYGKKGLERDLTQIVCFFK